MSVATERLVIRLEDTTRACREAIVPEAHSEQDRLYLALTECVTAQIRLKARIHRQRRRVWRWRWARRR